MTTNSNIWLTLLAIAIGLAVGAWQLHGCSECEARGGVYVKGMSPSGYVCVEGAR
jgi:hypothetical protein